MKKILVIEDNIGVLEEIRDILLMENYDVHVAENGWDGLEIANTELPDLIVCDILMPGLDGFQLLQQLKTYLLMKEIPLIFLSAKAHQFYAQKALNMGASAYLTKPISAGDYN